MLARLSVVLGKINPALGELWGIQLCIFFLVIVLTGTFLVGYLLQGTRVGMQLWKAVTRIRMLARTGKKVEPSAIAAVLTQEPFKHLWEEYRDTLHEVQRPADGSVPRKEVRATVPAEMFFTRDALVDGRLFDDFTRHLPGVLTGLGIIGTFAGLLEGLGRFDASSSATAVAGLKYLLDGVAHAFTTSVIAIGCAMLVIFISKFTLAIFYQWVESLNHLIDAFYATGAGEEYLSRLVHSSEQSDARAAGLKQELIEDFGRMLTALADRQISANAQNAQALGRYVGEAVKTSLSQMTSSELMSNPRRLAVGDTAGLRGVSDAREPSLGAPQYVMTLAELEAPIAQLRDATLHLAAAAQEIHAVLARLQKN
jgi:hypothetical protein